jgi:LuxR family glucitol operon transcriptional activator
MFCESFQGSGLSDFLPAEMRSLAEVRRSIDSDAPGGSNVSDFTLIDYLDFGHLSQLLGVHKAILPDAIQEQSVELGKQLEQLVPIRNRVCHSRPLEYDDYQRLHEFGTESVNNKAFSWRELKGTLALLTSNPNAVLRLQIPTYWTDKAQEIFHNLPQPDFDDTGFIGRRQDVQNIQRLIAGPYPVISIIGEGGVGKTALAAKALYDLLETDAKDKFDAIVWVSLKTSVLTASGVELVRGAVTDTLGLFGAIATAVGARDEAPTMSALLNEVRDFMEQFRVLLALDNLETVSQEEIVSFLRDIPLRSKVLITSRIGLGQLEHPYPLAPMDKTDAGRFLRRAAMSQNLREIVTAKQDVVDRWCQKLLYNPLALKWFVSSVSLGRAPEDLLDRSGGSYQTLLRFSFENLYSSLSALSQSLMVVCHVAGRPLSKTEMAVLVDSILPRATPDEIEIGLRTLVHSSVMQRIVPKEPGLPTQYQLGPFAREYLSHVQRPPKDITGKILEGQRTLKAESEISQRRTAYYKYDLGAIHCATRDQRLVGAKLRQALDLARSKDFDAAASQLDWAEKMLPGFSEIKRVKAMIAAESGDLLQAKEEYESAIELNPKSEICRFAYARLLHYDFEDADATIEQAQKVVALSPSDIPPRSLLAMALSRRGRFEEAAKIYEDIMGCLADAPPRHRTPILDQAAETYRRWAEQDGRSGEYLRCKVHLEKAISIAVMPLSDPEGGRDPYIGQRISEILSLMIYEGVKNSDPVFLDTQLSRVGDDVKKVRVRAHTRAPFEAVRDVYWQTRNWAMIQELLGRSSTVSPATPLIGAGIAERQTGTIKMVNMVGRYGFITTADSRDWFFHRRNLTNLSDFDDLRPGDKVEFSIGQNEKGECADLCTRLH